MFFERSRIIFALIFGLLVGSSTPLVAQGIQFGATPTFPPALYDYSASPDGKAITIKFIGLQVVADDGRSAESASGPPARKVPTDPVVSRVLSLVIPVKNGTPANTAFYIQGVADTNAGGQATLLTVINGQSTVHHFPKNSVAKDFLHTVDFSAPAAGEIRLTVVLIAERDILVRGAAATLMLDAIDTDAAQAQQRAAGRKK